MSAEQDILRVKNLQISATEQSPGQRPRQIVIVDNISFDLGKGRVLGLIGESGAGKSTIGLASMAYGRGGCEITGGEVWLDGQDVLQATSAEVSKLRGATVAYVAQSAAASFNPAHRLGQQVVEAAVQHGLMSRHDANNFAVDLFKRLGLPDPEEFGNRYPHQVSGGQLQRAMTAMAMCCRPQLMVFDEPTTALDVTTQISVLASIKQVIRESNTAALYITHDLAVVAQIADEIMVLRNGRMVEYGSTDQIINNPRERYTQSLVSVLAIVKAEAGDSDRAPVLAARNITAAYDNTNMVLQDVSVELHAGQTLSVVGESGSGKSTLARVITGLLPPLDGDVSMQGNILPPQLKNRSKEQLRVLQMIYQMPDVAMNPRHTVSRIIGRPLEFYFGIRGEERREKTIDLLRKIELDEEFYDRYPAELSGGQKQRICIARALAAEPELIICDEVTSALDTLVADGILNLLLQLQEENNVAYLFITHDIATVRAISDTIAVMYQGRLVRYGKKSTVLEPPYDDYTDQLLSSVPEMKLGWLERVLETRGKLSN